jgi:hypothetical protein
MSRHTKSALNATRNSNRRRKSGEAEQKYEYRGGRDPVTGRARTQM